MDKNTHRYKNKIGDALQLGVKNKYFFIYSN